MRGVDGSFLTEWLVGACTLSQNLTARWFNFIIRPTRDIAMNKPYQRDEAEQKQDFEGAKRDLKQSENDTQKDAAAQQPKESGGDEQSGGGSAA